MTGGLLQIVTSGKQDVYLTINPEITFFKKVFRRHTNFSLELVEINPEQPSEFNKLTSFILSNGDAVHRCYLEVELPNLSFSDKYITSPDYINKKISTIENLKLNYNRWKGYYDNLKGYVDVEIPLYRNLYNLLQTINITINTVKDEVTRYNFKNKSIKDFYKNKIDEMVYNEINITGYINSIDKLITNDETLANNNSIYILRTDILKQVNIMYTKMISYLAEYNNKKNIFSSQIEDNEKSNQINFNYSEFLGHNIFQYFTLNVGGIEVEKYSNDILHINQMHRINSNNMPNYLEMIGHTPEYYNFNNEPSKNNKVIIPLMFWFNKDAGASLPLVALQYSTIMIEAKVSNVEKIIAFQNFEKMFDDITIVRVEVDQYVLNTNLLYSSYNININDKTIIYHCQYINDELLKVVYPDLSANERNIILVNNGSLFTKNQITKIKNPEMSDIDIQNMNGPSGETDTSYLIDKYQWVGFMLAINNSIYNTLRSKIGSYYPYIDYNLYYSLIPNLKVKLIAEMVYLDDVERAKFANSKLEYIVETFKEDIFTVRNKDLFEGELSFNSPTKEIYWYIQPQVFYDGLTEYGQNTSLLYDTYKYFTVDLITRQRLTLNQLDVINPNLNMDYYTYVLSYQFLNNILVNGVYYKPFCLYPEETQPSGTVNLREIKGKQYRVEFNREFITKYNTFLNKLYLNSSPQIIESKNGFILKFISKSYDLFVVSKGSGKLLFST